MSFQDKGCFQLAFRTTEFWSVSGGIYTPKYVSRDVKLSGRYKLYIKGVSFVSDYSSTQLDIEPSWVFLLQSPNIIQNFVPNIPGYAFQFQNWALTDTNFNAKLSSCYGDMSFYSMAYIQDRMEFLITAGDTVNSTGNGVEFNNTLGDALLDLQGMLLFNFEFERVDGLY